MYDLIRSWSFEGLISSSAPERYAIRGDDLSPRTASCASYWDHGTPCITTRWSAVGTYSPAGTDSGLGTSAVLSTLTMVAPALALLLTGCTLASVTATMGP